jgi:hypothetical protein
VVRLPIDLADMLAQARSFGLGLGLAHQFLGQLTPEIKAGVLATARSQLVFQLGHADARELAPSFAPLTADDLRHLGAFEVALRPCVGGVTLGPVTGATYPLPPLSCDGHALGSHSRQRYGMPRAHIDAQMSARVTAVVTGGRANRILLPGHHP